MVCTKRGWRTSSPRTSRIRRMHQLSPWSKSTCVSLPHTAAQSSSRVTSSPARRASSVSTFIGWGCSGTGLPSRNSSSFFKSSVNSAKFNLFSMDLPIGRPYVRVMHGLILSLLLAALTPVTTITARRVERLVYVPVRVNGQGPFWFCLDSGSHHAVVDPFIVRRLGLTATAPGTTSGTGQGGVPSRRVQPLTLTLGTVKIHAAEPWEIDLSGVPIPKWVHGLIGARSEERRVGKE